MSVNQKRETILVQVHRVEGNDRELVAQREFPLPLIGISEWVNELKTDGLMKKENWPQYQFVLPESPFFMGTTA